MKDGGEPTCLIDFWMQDIVRETEAVVESEIPPPRRTSTAEIGSHLFDLLFASQDAFTSSLLWAVVLLDSHQEILARVRHEVATIWSPESSPSITADQLREMKYTEAVACEVLRIRAPATVVSHVAAKDFPLTDTYTIPKGAIVYPSVYESSFQGFVEPYLFDPDRFMDERQENRVYKKNYLVFGAGPHQCVGQRYPSSRPPSAYREEAAAYSGWHHFTTTSSYVESKNPFIVAAAYVISSLSALLACWICRSNFSIGN
ncbi:hypothetical protein C3L33_06076, partial [Rhododendron williamsianum]